MVKHFVKSNEFQDEDKIKAGQLKSPYVAASLLICSLWCSQPPISQCIQWLR